jgi:hypothetical protein
VVPSHHPLSQSEGDAPAAQMTAMTAMTWPGSLQPKKKKKGDAPAAAMTAI